MDETTKIANEKDFSKIIEEILLDPNMSIPVVVYRTIHDNYLQKNSEEFVGVMSLGMYEIATKYNVGINGEQHLAVQGEGIVCQKKLRCKSKQEYTKQDIHELNKYNRMLDNFRKKVNKCHGEKYSGKISMPTYRKRRTISWKWKHPNRKS